MVLWKVTNSCSSELSLITWYRTIINFANSNVKNEGNYFMTKYNCCLLHYKVFKHDLVITFAITMQNVVVSDSGQDGAMHAHKTVLYKWWKKTQKTKFLQKSLFKGLFNTIKT